MRLNWLIPKQGGSPHGRWLLIGLLLAITACAGSPQPEAGSVGAAYLTVPAPASPPAGDGEHPAVAAVPVEKRLRDTVRRWQGTPHRMGGTDRSGIDCSGFVQRLYRDLFDRTIPRSTALQVRSGRGIGRSRLRPGDLVFFRPPHKVRHVGIYLGHKEFAHASSSRGVTISNLGAPYWSGCYWTARRYLASP